MAKDIFKDTIVYTVLGFLPLGFATLFTPIYLSHLGTEQYGVLNLFLLYSGIITQIFTLGISQAFGFYYWDVYKNRDELKKLISTTLTTLISIQIIFIIIGILFGESLLSILVKDDVSFSYSPFFLLSLGYSAFMVFYELFLYFFRNENKIKLYAFLSISTLICFTIGSIIGVILLDLKALGAVFGRTAGYGLIILIFLGYFIRKYGLGFELKQVKILFIFSLPLFVNGLIGSFGHSIDRLLIERFDTLGNLGIYALAIVIISIIEIWFNAINNALSPTLYKFINEAHKIKSKEIKALGHSIIFAVIIGTTLIIAIIYPMLDLFIPEAFHESAKYIPILAMAFIYRVYSSLATISFYVKKKTKYLLINQSSTLLLMILFGYFFYKIWGIMGIVYTVYIVKLIEFLIIKSLSDKVLKLDFNFSKFITLSFILTLSALLSTEATELIPNNYLRYLIPLITLIIFTPILLKKEINNLVYCVKNRKILFN